MSHQDEEIVRDVLSLWERGIVGVTEAYNRLHHEDIHWWNSARGSVIGRRACIEGCEYMFELLGVASVRVPVRRLVSNHGVVFVERSDDLYRRDGSLIAAVPVTGVIEIDNGKIREWRDYCVDWLAAFLPKSANS